MNYIKYELLNKVGNICMWYVCCVTNTEMHELGRKQILNV